MEEEMITHRGERETESDVKGGEMQICMFHWMVKEKKRKWPGNYHHRFVCYWFMYRYQFSLLIFPENVPIFATKKFPTKR